MARIASAIEGIGLAITDQPRWLLLVLTGHLGFLTAAALEHLVGGPSGTAILAAEAVGRAPGPATLALVSGLILCLTMISRLRASQSGSLTPTSGTPLCALPTVQADPGLMARLNHDLRTPLNAIIGFAELMNREAFGPIGNERYRAYVADMRTCGLDLLRATESTLAMASLLTDPQGRNGDIVNLREMTGGIVGPHQAGHGCAVVDMMISSDLEVTCNDAILAQGIADLMRVAHARATPSGRIQLSARRLLGRIELAIDAMTDDDGCAPPRTGCAENSAFVEELALGTARTLLGHCGVPVVETLNRAGAWSVRMSLEEASQPDLFLPRNKLP